MKYELIYELIGNDEYAVIGYNKISDNVQEIIIPKLYNDKRVTTIKECAFINAELSSITADYISVIEEKAFSKMRYLTCCKFNELRIIARNAFSECQSLENIKSKSIGYIGDYAFLECEKLNEIELSNVRYTGRFSFFGCHELKRLNMQKAEKIDEFAFADCNKLKKIFVNKRCQISKNATYLLDGGIICY